MRRILQTLAVVIILSGAVTWLVLGANRGWTKTSMPVTAVDEVTGIEAIAYEDQFLPGLDFLGAAVAAGGLVAGASLFLSKSQQTKKNET
jgi:hypothetical protein